MEGIHGHHRSGDRQGMAAIPSRGNRVGVALDVDSASDLPGPSDDAREQMDGARTRVLSGSASTLASHRDRISQAPAFGGKPPGKMRSPSSASSRSGWRS
jgi:hypothetical protein